MKILLEKVKVTNKCLHAARTAGRSVGRAAAGRGGLINLAPHRYFVLPGPGSILVFLHLSRLATVFCLIAIVMSSFNPN